MKLRFTKMQGTGNDFVVIDATRARFQPTPALLSHLTDRHFGVGCDQVLVIEAPTLPDVDFDYRIFNADGSEVGQCGNGTRALARYVADNGLSSKSRLRVRTSTAVMELQRLDDGQVRVDMGAPRWAPDRIPLRLSEADRYRVALPGGTVEFGAVSMGNPHAVIRVDDVDAAPVEAVGRAFQDHRELFPDSVNVGFLQILDPARGRLRVWERGAGETLACGSGACAAMAVGRRWGVFDESVSLQMRGGSLALQWRLETTPSSPATASNLNSIFMTGPAETVFSGEIQWQP